MVESYVLEMAIDMVFPVQEIATGKGYKAMLSEEARAGDKCVREARKLRKSGDESACQKKYDEALKHYMKVRSEASKIEDETGWDWLISLFIKPWPILLTQVINADGDLKGMTRSSTLKLIDSCIAATKKEKTHKKD